MSLEFTPRRLSEEVLVQASSRFTLKAASPWLLPSVEALGHFPKRDNELDGGVYTFKTEPDGWIAVSLVYIGSSRPTGGGDCGAEGDGLCVT